MKIERIGVPSTAARRLLLVCVWLGVLLVAAYDIYFAWSFRDVFASWELNPVVRWGVDHFGLLAFLAFKIAGLILVAGLVWHCRRQRQLLAHFLTVFVISVHALLAVFYVIGYQQPTAYDLACRSAAARLIK